MRNLSIIFFSLILFFKKTSASKDFSVLLFGGDTNGRDVQLYNLHKSERICKLNSLLVASSSSPFASIINENVTICGGQTFNDHCNYWNGGNWQQSEIAFGEGNRLHSSAVATFVQKLTKRSMFFVGEKSWVDHKVWTFFGGDSQEVEDTIAIWRSGQNDFKSEEFPFDLGEGACSVRLNQSHAIGAKGSKSVFWYLENSQFPKKFQADEAVNNDLYFAACGIYFSDDTGFQFVSAGGAFRSGKATDLVRVYNFESSNWLEGQKLAKKLQKMASIQYENTFAIIGGCENGENGEKEVWKYDDSMGWRVLPMQLETADFAMGSIRAIPKYFQC